MLKIENDYGNFDATKGGAPKGYRLVRGERLGPLCRALGIRFVQAVTDWRKSGRRHPAKPVFGAVIVTVKSAPKLEAALAERTARTTTADAVAKRERDRERRKALKAEREEQRQARCHDVGIHPDGQAAKWLAGGAVDEDTAELIGFKARYRHEHTDYEECLDGLREMGEEDVQDTARLLKSEDAIPDTWPRYLAVYGFDSEVAAALATVLSDPQDAHPVWFKEAEIAVRRAGLPLDTLTYEKIGEAIDHWRSL